MVSAENFMKVLFFTYDFVCSYEHDRVHVAACGSFPQYLQPDGGLHLHVCGRVPIRQSGPVHQFIGIVATILDDLWLQPRACDPSVGNSAINTKNAVAAWGAVILHFHGVSNLY